MKGAQLFTRLIGKQISFACRHMHMREYFPLKTAVGDCNCRLFRKPKRNFDSNDDLKVITVIDTYY